MVRPPMSRRSLLRALAVLGISNYSSFNFARPSVEVPSSRKSFPRVILFEMFGGNDNLNTLTPYKEDFYYHLRPTIGVKPEDLIPISDELALNNALRPLMPSWNSGELAIVQDVGYPGSVQSHFSAIGVIEAGGDNRQASDVGWVANMLLANKELTDKRYWDLGSVWAGGHIDSLIGGGVMPYSPSTGVFNKYLALYNEDDTSLLDHSVNRTIKNYRDLIEPINKKLIKKSDFYDVFHTWHTPDFLVGSQCIDVLRFIENDIRAPVFKIGMSGFDLHSQLRGNHEKVLGRAASHLAKLRESLIELDEWDNTVILAYSEFGRRPHENASLGTDHGTAGPMFLLGGGVSGGIKGARSNLEKLDKNGNIAFSTDYRSVFSSIASDWWQVKNNPFLERGLAPLSDIFKRRG